MDVDVILTGSTGTDTLSIHIIAVGFDCEPLEVTHSTKRPTICLGYYTAIYIMTKKNGSSFLSSGIVGNSV